MVRIFNLFANTLGFTFMAAIYAAAPGGGTATPGNFVGPSKEDISLTAIPVGVVDPQVVLRRVLYANPPLDGSDLDEVDETRNSIVGKFISMMAASPVLRNSLFSPEGPWASPLEDPSDRILMNALKLTVWHAMQESKSTGKSTALKDYDPTPLPPTPTTTPPPPPPSPLFAVQLDKGSFPMSLRIGEDSLQAPVNEEKYAPLLQKVLSSHLTVIDGGLPNNCADLDACLKNLQNDIPEKKPNRYLRTPQNLPIFAALGIDSDLERCWARIETHPRKKLVYGQPFLEFKFKKNSRPKLPLNMTVDSKYTYHLLSINDGKYVRGLDGNFYAVDHDGVKFIHRDLIFEAAGFDVGSVIYGLSAAPTMAYDGFSEVKPNTDVDWKLKNVIFAGLAAFFFSILLGSIFMIIYDKSRK